MISGTRIVPEVKKDAASKLGTGLCECVCWREVACVLYAAGFVQAETRNFKPEPEI